MGGHQWRCPAKFVAWFDMIITVVALVYMITVSVLAHKLINSAMDHPKITEEMKRSFKTALIILWVCVGVMIAASILLFWAAVRLLSATETGRDPDQASKMTLTWLVVAAIYLVLNIVGSALQKQFVHMGVHIGLRLVFIFIVFSFMRELNRNAVEERKENSAISISNYPQSGAFAAA